VSGARVVVWKLLDGVTAVCNHGVAGDERAQPDEDVGNLIGLPQSTQLLLVDS
jgi:hypothetical protein